MSNTIEPLRLRLKMIQRQREEAAEARRLEEEERLRAVEVVQKSLRALETVGDGEQTGGDGEQAGGHGRQAGGDREQTGGDLHGRLAGGEAGEAEHTEEEMPSGTSYLDRTWITYPW
jgi:hypothetical protein